MLTAMIVIAALAAQDEGMMPKLDYKGTALEKITALEGHWVMADGDNDGQPDGTVDYHITSNGSAVVETLFRGTPHEMVTVYTLDGDRVLMTHYCALGNQPRLIGQVKKDNVIHFTFLDGTNIAPSSDSYMGELVMTMTDKDHLRQEWSHYNGVEKGGTAVFEFTRVSQ